jgi:hypothetical protein
MIPRLVPSEFRHNTVPVGNPVRGVAPIVASNTDAHPTSPGVGRGVGVGVGVGVGYDSLVYEYTLLTPGLQSANILSRFFCYRYLILGL